MALWLHGAGRGSDLSHALRRENFVVAPVVLPGRWRRELLAVYRYARFVDDLGEDRTDGQRRLDELEADLRRVQAGAAARLPVLVPLRSGLLAGQIPMEPLLRLVAANRMDLQVRTYGCFDELLGYCQLSANPVGEIVLHLFGRADSDRLKLSDRICTALQLLEHWQDVGEDYRAGRVYLPQDDLRLFGVAEGDLGQPSASTRLRNLVAFETTRALAWLDAGAPLVSTLHGWARLAVSGYVAGGRAAARALRSADHDPLAGDVKARRAAIGAQWLQATVRWPG